MKKNRFVVFLLTLSMTVGSLVRTAQASGDISHQEAQDRAYKMAYSTWHYQKSLNGNTTSYIQLPDYLKNETDAIETGIPYNYGGSDGIDTSSNIQWSNFFDAINKGATAGNVLFQDGYKGETAGIDSASFIQSTLKIPGVKLTPNTLTQYLIPIAFEDLKNMDILLAKGKSAAFFQDWVYDDLGNIIGANTLEATIDNDDNTGQKVKEYYRSINYITNNYKAYRYEGMSNDYIENNSLQPTIESPLYRQAVDKTKNNGVLNFKWDFNDINSSGYQTAYRIRIYSGDVNNSSSTSGTLVKQVLENTSATETNLYFNDMPEGNYYFMLETKNSRGYWSNPVISPFKYMSGTDSTSSKIKQILRYGGATRYETSKLIAENNFTNFNFKNVVIASGNNFPDGLSGVTLARRLNAPLLLVDKNPTDAGSQVVLQYIIKNIKSDGKIYILGGEGAVSSSYVEYLMNYGYSGNNIVRVGGLDRHETSVNIAKQLNMPKGSPVVISNDSGFADALSISSKAGSSQMPILLTPKDQLDQEVSDYIKILQPSKVYIVGGTGVISDNVKNTIGEITGLDGGNIVRLGGQDRYETSQRINSYFYDNSNRNIYIANGENFPDSLSGSAAAAFNNGAPLVLVSDASYVTTAKTINYLSGSNQVTLKVLGGEGIISNYLISKINSIFSKLN